MNQSIRKRRDQQDKIKRWFEIVYFITSPESLSLQRVPTNVCPSRGATGALCNEDPNGNVPLGKSCNRYWQCQGGYPRLQRCPAMLVFDRRSLRCVVPPTDECEIPTTTLSPQEEEENSRPGQQNKRPDYPDGQPGRQRARN
ncbi:hypothetical protein RR48_13608 [Papilio machaon]|uniref:Chitin-binding type-2 domain-containing protein n=1 Tax=Papilio machaon TaxID=76193 RepID=A0A194RA91_PAPMA|nr:hypothetical protein RR48_13608 [Papilio machaon]